MASDDPFYVVRDTIAAHLENAKAAHARWRDLLINSDTYSNPEYKKAKSTLVKEIKAAENPLAELRKALAALEKNRAQFSQISDGELAQRRGFIDATKADIDNIKSDMTSPQAQQKIRADESKAMKADATMGATNAREMENTRFVGNQRTQTHMMIAQQDEDLEALGQSVDRLGRMGAEINEELKDQNRMLAKLEDDVDEAGERMNFVMAKLSKLLKTKDSCQIWSIIILTLILVILVFLLIYT